jgi:hypothetical protein
MDELEEEHWEQGLDLELRPVLALADEGGETLPIKIHPDKDLFILDPEDFGPRVWVNDMLNDVSCMTHPELSTGPWKRLKNIALEYYSSWYDNEDSWSRKECFPDLIDHDKSAVGALAREGVEGVIVANRTYDRAVELARQVEGHAVPFGRLAEVLSGADIVLSSTAAPHQVLTMETFRAAFPDGRRRPLLVIDIAMPRDVEPAIGDESEVFLYNVDDLRHIVDEHVRLREGAFPEADRIIRAHFEEFRAWYASQEVVPVIRRMRARAERFRAAELERLFRGMEHLDEAERARVEEFSKRLLNKLIHDPTSRLRKGMARGGGADELNFRGVAR